MSDFTIIQLDVIDSTNNYAMQLIDANKAYHGLTIVAHTQTAGKGQRGRSWVAKPGDALLMSIVISPGRSIGDQFSFNSGIAVAVAKVLQKLHHSWNIHIKWPNDIIVNDKKAGGILIENVLRGSSWSFSVIGIGINVLQNHFAADLPYATSLAIEAGRAFDIDELRDSICESILSFVDSSLSKPMEAYNALLYKKGKENEFRDHTGDWTATIIAANSDGTLTLQKQDGAIIFCQHGQVEWLWG